MTYSVNNNQDKGYTGQATGALAGALLGVALLGLGLYFIFGFGRSLPAHDQSLDDINFLSETNTSMTTTNNEATSLQAEILRPGTGAPAKEGDLVTVNYTGWLTDGT